MANKQLITQQDGTPKSIVFADHANDFLPSTNNNLMDTVSGNREDVELQTANLADGAAMESNKADLGAVWAAEYTIRGAVELDASPYEGDLINLYWAPSQSSVAARGNAGGVSGVKGAFTGYSTNLAEALKQLELIGSFVVTGDATTVVQIAECGVFSPKERYGSLIVNNESDADFFSDDIEIHFVLDPVIPEAQD